MAWGGRGRSFAALEDRLWGLWARFTRGPDPVAGLGELGALELLLGFGAVAEHDEEVGEVGVFVGRIVVDVGDEGREGDQVGGVPFATLRVNWAGDTVWWVSVGDEVNQVTYLGGARHDAHVLLGEEGRSGVGGDLACDLRHVCLLGRHWWITSG